MVFIVFDYFRWKSWYVVRSRELVGFCFFLVIKIFLCMKGKKNNVLDKIFLYYVNNIVI